MSFKFKQDELQGFEHLLHLVSHLKENIENTSRTTSVELHELPPAVIRTDLLYAILTNYQFLYSLAMDKYRKPNDTNYIQ